MKHSSSSKDQPILCPHFPSATAALKSRRVSKIAVSEQEEEGVKLSTPPFPLQVDILKPAKAGGEEYSVKWTLELD